jgi:rhodanese-related sulfurtransferase
MLVLEPLLVDEAEVDPIWLAEELLSAGLVLLGDVELELWANAHRPEQSRVTATRINLRMGEFTPFSVSDDEVEQERTISPRDTNPVTCSTYCRGARRSAGCQP